MQQNRYKYELAKSWFQLSQLFAVIAGLFLVIASLHASSYSGLKYNFELPMSVCQKVTSNSELNILNASYPECTGLLEIFLQDEIAYQSKFTNLFIFIGFLMVSNSIFVWFMGRRKILNKDFEDMKYFIFLIGLNLIIISLFWYFIYRPDITLISQTVTIGNKTIKIPLRNFVLSITS